MKRLKLLNNFWDNPKKRKVLLIIVFPCMQEQESAAPSAFLFLAKFLEAFPTVYKVVRLFIVINLLNAVNVTAKLIGN